MSSENAAPTPSPDPIPQPGEPTPAEPMVLLPPDAPESIKDRWLWVGVLVLLAATAFIPAIRGAFIWQDDKNVTENVLVAAPDALGQIWVGHFSELFGSPTGATGADPALPNADPAAPAGPEKLPVTQHFQPLGYTLLWLEYRGWGTDPFGYHAVQVALHALAVILLWLVLRNLRVGGAWLAAGVCAVHPLNAEAVSWVSQTPLVLGVTLAVAAVLFYLESADVSNGELKTGFAKAVFTDSATAHTIALVLFAAAVLAQPLLAPVALVVPLLLWATGKKLDGKEWGRIIPMVVIGAAALALYVAVELKSNAALTFDIPPAVNVPALGLSIWFYLTKALFPFGLSLDYGVSSVGATGWIGLAVAFAALAGVAMKARAGHPIARAIAVVFGVYILLLSTTSGPVPTTEHGFGWLGDRFAYPAGLAVIVGLVALVARAVGPMAVQGVVTPKRAKAAFAAGGVVLIALTSLTWARANVFSDTTGLWTDTIARNPNSYLGHYELGTQHVDDGLAMADQAAQDLVDRRTDDAAEAKKESDRLLNDAVALFDVARTLRPQSPRPSVEMGVVKYQQHDDAAAEVLFREALAVAPDDAQANFNLGRVLAREFRTSPNLLALANRLRFEQSLPTLTDWFHRRLFDRRCLFDAALAHLQRAVQSDPGLGEAMLQQGLIWRDLGDDARAAEQFQNAVRVKPGYADAHQYMAILFRKYGQYRESLFHWTQVYRLSPPGPQLQVEMGTAVGLVGDFKLARQWFLQALALQPDNADALRGLALAERMLPHDGAPSTLPATRANSAPSP